MTRTTPVDTPLQALTPHHNGRTLGHHVKDLAQRAPQHDPSVESPSLNLEPPGLCMRPAAHQLQHVISEMLERQNEFANSGRILSVFH
ncbi:hypothetical protein AVEN_199011-1 [Araneus ventricosus]|uniref:Uncharacterized protein n=1 Tax=Araneus ventricosus TaxID=182803 RepID=A0A4Y2LJ26_ARAVE|nr:hypothetical protein AVEN_199011-1 [Araneus ventricosus]